MTDAAPAVMRAIRLGRYGPGGPALEVVEMPVPRPGPGEVLVRVSASAINPNDLLFLGDGYVVRKPAPVVPGFDAAGRVVAGGGGLLARGLVGRRVACSSGDGDGAWAEYLVTSASRCAPVRSFVSDAESATMLTNPIAAWVLLHGGLGEGHRAFAQTAAAGALGRMLGRLSAKLGHPMINIVRTQQEVALLAEDQAEHVLCSTDADFDQRLRDLAQRLRVTLAFDPVAGPTTGRVLSALPRGARIRVYGWLSNAPCQIEHHALIFEGKSVDGFTLYDWIARTSALGQLRVAWGVQPLLADVLRTKIRATFPLEGHDEALALARQGGADGKVLFVT